MHCMVIINMDGIRVKHVCFDRRLLFRPALACSYPTNTDLYYHCKHALSDTVQQLCKT
jgi:hypothetical protein